MPKVKISISVRSIMTTADQRSYQDYSGQVSHLALANSNKQFISGIDTVLDSSPFYGIQEQP